MVGLLTFHDTNNFGSYLQTYGLYRKIKELGNDCDIIDYQCESIVRREIPKSFEFTFNLRSLIIEILLNPPKRKKYKNLQKFLCQNMTLSERVFRNNISKISDKYDKFFVGSDIVWGLDITQNDTTYFLDFIKDTHKKYAFASSVGNPWNTEQQILIKQYLTEFSDIAVREEESADWIEKLTKKRPYVVCDPTMLLTSDEWTRFVSDKYRYKKYILVYFPTESSLKAAKSYSERYGIPCYVINQSLPLKNVININPTTIEDFLSLLFYAAFVCTGSYHGMLFSIYFNKEFAYFNRAHKSRMNTLANKLGVLDRDGMQYDISHMKSIEYDKVNALATSYRNYSIQILKEMLSQ